MSIFWISLGQGLAVAAILAHSSVAFTLEYAVSRVVNLAHGEILTIGAYAAYVSEINLHQNVYVCAVIATLFGSLAAVAMNWAVIELFRNQKSLSTLIATLGVSLELQNLLLIIFGGASLSYAFSQGNLLHVGPFLWTTLTIEVMVSAVVVAFLIFLLLQRTRPGKVLRAVSQNRELSRVSGIPARSIVMRSWTVAGALSGFAGSLYVNTFNGTTVAGDMTKMTNPPGMACYSYASCVNLIKAHKKISYEGASGSIDYNKFHNNFGPYAPFIANASTGNEVRGTPLSAKVLGDVTNGTTTASCLAVLRADGIK